MRILPGSTWVHKELDENAIVTVKSIQQGRVFFTVEDTGEPKSLMVGEFIATYAISVDEHPVATAGMLREVLKYVDAEAEVEVRYEAPNNNKGIEIVNAGCDTAPNGTQCFYITVR